MESMLAREHIKTTNIKRVITTVTSISSIDESKSGVMCMTLLLQMNNFKIN
jgi:hypothetical protein